MDETFKEPHLRMLYQLLGHNGHHSRVGSLDYTTKKYDQVYLKGEEELNVYARCHNTKRNVFISRAFRDSSGVVLGTWVITFDIDPIRPKDTASSDEQHEAALSAGRRILSRYSGGYLASSGNGALLIYRLSNPLYALEGHYNKEKVLIKELQELVNDLGVKVDATSYAEAVIKAIGTFSTKGDSNLRRCSRFIEPPFPPYRNCSQLLKRLDAINVTESKPVEISLPSIQNGDRSVADYHLVRFLKQEGAGPAAALAALQANPLGRRDDEKDQARLITKIYGEEANTLDQPKSDNYFEKLFTPKESSDGDIRTGFSVLDTALGALPKGELVTFSARSGFGKSTFACTCAELWRRQGKRVLYFSTEMHRDYIMHKLVSLVCEIPLARTIQKEFAADEIKRIRNYEQQLLLSPIAICDSFQPTLQLVQNEVLKHKPDIIIFDHITQSGTHWEKIAQFTRDLKDLTSKENCVTVLLSMLNEPGRGKDGNVATSIRGDIRGTQEILFLSAVFCMFSNPYDVKGRYQPVDVLIAKNRYGISNQIIPLTVDKEISKYMDRRITIESDLP